MAFRCLACCGNAFTSLVSNIPVPNFTSCCKGKGPRKDKSTTYGSGESLARPLAERRVARRQLNHRGGRYEPPLSTVHECKSQESSQETSEINKASSNYVVVSKNSLEIEPEQKHSLESAVTDPSTVSSMQDASTQCNLDVNKGTSTKELLVNFASSNEERLDESQEETVQGSRVIVSSKDFDVHPETNLKEISVEVETSHDACDVNERKTSFEIPAPKVETTTENVNDIDVDHQEFVEGSALLEPEMPEEGSNLVLDSKQETNLEEISVEVETSRDACDVNERKTSFEIPAPKVETTTENVNDIDVDHQEFVEGNALVEPEKPEEGTNLVLDPKKTRARRRRSTSNVQDRVSSSEDDLFLSCGGSSRYSQDEYHDAD